MVVVRRPGERKWDPVWTVCTASVWDGKNVLEMDGGTVRQQCEHIGAELKMPKMVTSALCTFYYNEMFEREIITFAMISFHTQCLIPTLGEWWGLINMSQKERGPLGRLKSAHTCMQNPPGGHGSLNL